MRPQGKPGPYTRRDLRSRYIRLYPIDAATMAGLTEDQRQVANVQRLARTVFRRDARQARKARHYRPDELYFRHLTWWMSRADARRLASGAFRRGGEPLPDHVREAFARCVRHMAKDVDRDRNWPEPADLRGG